MRNLVQYPITYGEACSALQDAQQSWIEKYRENIGGTGGVALLLVEQFIRTNKDLFEEFAKIKLGGVE